jgi:hypothetical protein
MWTGHHCQPVATIAGLAFPRRPMPAGEVADDGAAEPVFVAAARPALRLGRSCRAEAEDDRASQYEVSQCLMKCSCRPDAN